MADNRGVYRKFVVTRTDGTSAPGEKHHDCSYFVLDLEHDPHAIPALRAYAKACRKKRPDLARDIDTILETPHSNGMAPDGPSGMLSWLMDRRGSE